MHVGGIVLCGGQSRRMGQPKAWLPFAGELMLPRVARLLAEAVPSVIVVAARGQELPPLPADITIVRDERDCEGPLEGLRVGLEALRGDCDAAFVSSCDVPFLRPALVRRLIELLGEHDICVPSAGGRLHPLAAVYRIAVLDRIPELLRAGRRRPAYLFDEVPTRLVTAAELGEIDPELRSLWNLNTPEDYQQAAANGRAAAEH